MSILNTVFKRKYLLLTTIVSFFAISHPALSQSSLADLNDTTLNKAEVDSHYISDLEYQVINNGLGPVEKDRSNGSEVAGDGAVITLNGKVFEKGIGVHASSEIIIDLNGKYEQFYTVEGVDDSVGRSGSVRFQVYVDGQLKNNSPEMYGATQSRTVNVDVKGKNELRLVVLGGRDTNKDQANWADAKLILSKGIVNNHPLLRPDEETAVNVNTSEEYLLDDTPLLFTATRQVQAAGEFYISDLPFTVIKNGLGPVEKDRSNGSELEGDGGPLTLNGTIYEKGLGVHSDSKIEIQLDGLYQQFQATVGVDDEVGNNGSVRFLVHGDGRLIGGNGGEKYGNSLAKDLDVDITGYNTLRLSVTPGRDKDKDHANWANAKIISEALFEPVSPYYLIQEGDTVTTLAQALYGSESVAEVLGNTLTELGYSIEIGEHILKSDLPLALRLSEYHPDTNKLPLNRISEKSNRVEERYYISDLDFQVITNGLGPVERDSSNGSEAENDGSTITLNGEIYEKGLGVYAKSEIIVNLNGKYDQFYTVEGVDDSAGKSGSVRFQVYVDGQLKNNSPEMYGTSQSRIVNVDVKGKNELRLLVLGGRDTDKDQANWADAQLISSQATNDNGLKFYVVKNGDSLESLSELLYGTTELALFLREALNDLGYSFTPEEEILVSDFPVLTISSTVLPQFTLTASTVGEGSIVGLDTICDDNCAQLFDVRSEVTLSAIAAEGYAFTGWSEACATTSTIETCKLSVINDIEVQANFKIATPVISHVLPQTRLVPFVNDNINLSATITDDKGLTNVSWACVEGCLENGVMESALTPEQWEVNNIALVVGFNAIEIIAEDADGNTVNQRVEITRENKAIQSSYTPPIGIPDPAWTESLHPILTKSPKPLEWSTEMSGFYYVDPQHNNATDENNLYGYPEQPRASIPRIVDAGSYVELHGNYSSRQTVSYRCTADKPCWLRGASQEEWPIHSGSLAVKDSTYLFMENINFDGGVASALSITGNSHNVVFRHSRIANREQPAGASTGISIIPDLGQLMENIVIYDNNFEELGDWTVTKDIDFHGVTPSLWGRDNTTELRKLWILNNYCTHLSGDCVQVNAANWLDSYKYLHHVYIGHNESYQNRQTGFWVKQGSDVVISQNKASGNYGNGAANAGGGIGYQYDKHNLWIINNEIHDTVFGIRQSDTGTSAWGNDVYIIGNLIYDIHPAETNTAYDATDSWSEGAAIALWHGSLNRYIVDNTIYDVHDGVNAIFNGGVHLSGNIISQKDDHTANHFFDISHPGRNNLVSMNNNIFFDDTTESYFSWQNRASRMSSIEEVKLKTDLCENCWFINPLFINASSEPTLHNFELNFDSPAVTGNRKHFSYDLFEKYYGLSIDKDFNGKPRSAQRRSIGAFQYIE
jgi:hypothetical protein